jgi:hypothetical protein
MSLMDTLREIKTLDDAVKDQIMYIDEFERTNRNNVGLVEEHLSGGTAGHDQTMKATLQAVDNGLTRARTELQRAADALQRVQAI